jgi:hypothetical protein
MSNPGYSYDRQGARPQINRLTPLAQSVEKDYKAALASLEQVVRTLQLIEREAPGLLPPHYHKVWGVPSPGDDIEATLNDAASLRAEIEKSKILPEMKRLTQWVEELASEAKARHGE